MNTSQEHTSPFLTRFPVEIRQQIYDICMLYYIQDAAQSVHHVGHWTSETRQGISREEQLIAYESSSQDSPPLMLTCKQIARELAPVAARHIRFVIGSDSTISKQQPRRPQQETSLSLPKRCKSGAALRHLQIEWRIHPTILKGGEGVPEVKMRHCTEDIRMLLAGGITSARITMVIPEALAGSFVPQATAFGSMRLTNVFIEPALDVLIDMIQSVTIRPLGSTVGRASGVAVLENR